MKKASVIVCTYNRCDSLRDTLEALKKLMLPHAQWLEIIIVDNNSKDKTKPVVENAAENSPYPIRYVFESRQGKSYALNRGIQEAQGDYLLFTDDDVLPDPKWAQTLIDGFERYQADSVGGKVMPLWQTKPSRWVLSPSLAHLWNGVLAILDYGDKVLTATQKDENFLYGCNIGFKREVFQNLGVYRVDLGPSANELYRGEDTEMMRRLLMAGKKIVYIPDARVHHKVEKERLALSYARRRFFQGGQSDYLRFNPAGTRIPKWFIRRCAGFALKAIGLYLCGKPEIAIEAELHFWSQFGQIVGSWKSRRTQASQISERKKETASCAAL